MVAGKAIEIRQENRYSLGSQHVLAMIMTCNLCIFIFMSICLVSSYWITAEGFRQGLLYLCIEETDPMSKARYEPLPFNLNKDDLGPGCHPNRDKGYLKFCTFLCLITQLSSLTSAILTVCTMRFKDSKQLSCLKLAICTILVVLVCDLLLLFTYQNEFAKELDNSNRNLWELNRAFGLACGCAILALGNLTLLLVALHKISTQPETEPISI